MPAPAVSSRVAGGATELPNAVARFHIFGKHKVVQSKSAEHYRCYDASNQILFSALAYRSSRPTSVYLKGDESKPDRLVKLRKSFPLTGKIDVLDPECDSPVGMLTRSRKIFDSSERLLGRFHDPTTWREHLGESAADFVGQLVFGDVGINNGSSASRYPLTVDKQTVGLLARDALPFFPDPPPRDGPNLAGRIMRTVLPKKLIDPMIGVSPPIGWRLDLYDLAPISDLNLILVGAMMTIELRRWTGG